MALARLRPLALDAFGTMAPGAAMDWAPGYRDAWLKMGFTEHDIDGLSEKLVDGIIAWGDVDAIEARLAEHAEAGASHICIHPLHPHSGQGTIDDAVLTALAPGGNS